MVEQAPEVKHELSSRADIEAYCATNEIQFQACEHEPVFTIATMLPVVKHTGDFENALIIKNLFFYDKKKKERMWLVCAAHDTEVDIKALTKKLGVGSGNLRGANEETLYKQLGAIKGSVNVFCLLNDKKNEVKLLLDKRATEASHVAYHPQDNTCTIAFSTADQQKIITNAGNECEIVDFSALAPAAGAAPAEKKQKPAKGPKKAQPEKPKPAADADQRGIEFTKEQNFSKWYSQIITKSELIEYYDISGCYILRPASYFIWEQIQNFADVRFKAIGVENAYFPMFVTEAALNKEKNHVEGFTPEVAWVTKSGQSEMPEPIAIRPTSETIMYPSYAKWIRSHRDLPLLINQWTNVVRWEFKHPTPFIRTREFLWQEGHTAHETSEDAAQFQHKIQEVYANIYEELLAVPVVRGRKSEDERFAGAQDTATVELYVPVSGRGIQGATSHHLGQNFSKMFEVMYEDSNSERKHVWQTSWGISTRSIGSMIMIHSDNKGLVLPPKVAKVQFVIIPIKKSSDDPAVLNAKAHEIAAQLREAGMRVAIDDSDTHNPGYKFNEWEVRGTPVRIEIGMRDIEKSEIKCVVRHSGEKFQSPWAGLQGTMRALLESIHQQMYVKAEQARDSHLKTVATWEEFMSALNNRDICLADWCDEKECEERIKDRSKEESLAAMEEMNEDEALLTGSAKTLCIPYRMGRQASGQADAFNDVKCFFCNAPAKVTALWGRSY